MLVPLGDFDRLFDYLREAERLAAALGDQRRLGFACVSLAYFFRSMGNYDRALEAAQRARALGEAAGEFGVQVVADMYQGMAYDDLGDYRRAMKFLSRSIDSLQGDLIRQHFGLASLPSAVSRAILASSLAQLGQFAEATAYEADAVRIAEAAQNPYSQIVAYRCGGDLYLRKGDFDKATRRFEQSLALAEALQIRELVPGVAWRLGSAYASSGRLSEGLALLKQAWEASNSMKVRHVLSGMACSLGEAHLLEGRADAAAELARRALDLSRRHKERGHEGWALRLLGEIAAHPDPPDVEPAEAHYRQAMALADDLAMRPLVAHCHLGLGKLYARTGKRQPAQERLTTATTMYREMGMTCWLEGAEAEIRE